MKYLFIYALLIPKILLSADCPSWNVAGFNLESKLCFASGGTAWVYNHPKNPERIIKVFGLGYKEVFVDELLFSDILKKENIPTLKALSHTNLNTNENSLGQSSWYIEKIKLESTMSQYCKDEATFQRIPNLKGLIDVISKIKMSNWKSITPNKRNKNDKLMGKLITDWHIENFMHDKKKNWYLIDFQIHDIKEYLSINQKKSYDFNLELQNEIFELCPVSKNSILKVIK